MIRRLPWRLMAGLAMVGVLLTVTGCIQNQPQNTIHQWGANNRRIWDVYSLIWVLAGIVGVLVEGLLVYTLIKYRGRKRAAHDRPVPVHGNTKLEIAWTIVPAIILVIILIPTLRIISDLDKTPTNNPMHVTVVGHQFFFQFIYDDLGNSPAGVPVTTNGELHIPAGRTVDLKLESSDVIHSFWVPVLAGKTDVVPGRTNHMWLEADNPGEYSGQCAEFCGLGHANMRFKVVAQSDADFNSWVDGQLHPAPAAGPGDPAAGQALFTSQGCSGCHSVTGAKIVGPTWKGLYGSQVALEGGQTVTADDAYIHESILSPNAKIVAGYPASVMPSFQGTLNDQQINDIIAYMKTLK